MRKVRKPNTIDWMSVYEGLRSYDARDAGAGFAIDICLVVKSKKGRRCIGQDDIYTILIFHYS